MDPATQIHKNLFVMYGLTFCRKGAPRPFVWGRGEGEEEEGIVAPLGEWWVGLGSANKYLRSNSLRSNERKLFSP